jgi:hypothetical protein
MQLLICYGKLAGLKMVPLLASGAYTQPMLFDTITGAQGSICLLQGFPL